MPRFAALLLAVVALNVAAPAAEAQFFLTPLDGDWLINIPQDPYGPVVWTLDETGSTVTGTASVEVTPGVEINGELNGQKLFLIFYLLNSTFEVDSDIGGLPDVSASNVAFVRVYGGNVYGYAITTVSGVPIDSTPYQVSGQKQRCLSVRIDAARFGREDGGHGQ